MASIPDHVTQELHFPHQKPIFHDVIKIQSTTIDQLYLLGVLATEVSSP